MTEFARLSAKFRICDAQLRAQILDGGALRSQAALVRLTASLMVRLESFVPQSIDELEDILDFFAMQRLEFPEPNCERMLKPWQALAATDLEKLDVAAEPAIRSRKRSAPMPEGLSGSDLTDYVLSSVDRLAVFDLRSRYLAVSEPEAAALGVRPNRICGRSLRDVMEHQATDSLMSHSVAALIAKEGQRWAQFNEMSEVTTFHVSDTSGCYYADLVRYTSPEIGESQSDLTSVSQD
ncbi:hypothetical protein FEV53_17815 [Palleronia caenipelagi]|uniref:PAS domain-containing protein n=2 Tax=Palleronia caenipelagi TaxID=2489174 RepID=A0A547PLQ4_9RHOB|nr:hypothetical protein FEV53_17815 [Palleronia caenipelagi]